jgi:hypothetical protein
MTLMKLTDLKLFEFLTRHTRTNMKTNTTLSWNRTKLAGNNVIRGGNIIKEGAMRSSRPHTFSLSEKQRINQIILLYR